jgi:putative CocE/NonD family hydrolase
MDAVHVEIPLGDGAFLAGDLWLPAGAGALSPVPAVVSLVPYHKDDFMAGVYERRANVYFAEHGYATLLADFRGLGSSSGVVWDAMHRSEADDGAALVEWAAAQDWCDGNVGMWGLSYGGITSFKTAALKPAHLKAIVPMMGSLDVYHDWVAPGGCRNMLGANGIWGSFMVAMALLPPMRQDTAGRWHEVWRERLDAAAPWLLSWPAHPDRDEYWAERAVDPADIEVPMYLIGGWRDLFPEAMVRAFIKAGGPRKLLMGPWLHVHPEEAEPHGIDHLAQMLRWWDRWLKGEENGIADEPGVQYFSQGEDRWFESAAWPPEEGRSVEFALAADGALTPAGAAAPAGGEVEHTVDPRTGVQAGLWDPFGLGIGMPLDQGPDDLRSLTFTSAPLAEAVRITGSPSVSLSVGATGAGGALNLVAKLCDVAPDGASSLITTGWLNGRHRTSHAAAEPVAEGVQYAYELELWPTGYRLEAGHRLRLSVTGADFPRIWPSATAPTLRLSTGASRLVLPVSGDAAVREFTPAPSELDITHFPFLLDHEAKWRIDHDLVAGEASVTSGGRFAFTTPQAGGRLAVDHTGTASVRAGRPDGACVRGETVMHATTPQGARVEVVARTFVTADATHVTATVTVDGAPVFDRAWRAAGPVGGAVETTVVGA